MNQQDVVIEYLFVPIDRNYESNSFIAYEPINVETLKAKVEEIYETAIHDTDWGRADQNTQDNSIRFETGKFTVYCIIKQLPVLRNI